MSVSSRILYMKSIIVLLGAIMLLACKNDIKEVNALAEREKRPDIGKKKNMKSFRKGSMYFLMILQER